MISRLPASTDGLDVLRRFSEIQLVVVDIDGTLISAPSGTVADVIADLNGSLRHHSRGVTVTIATGRAFAGARPVIDRLRLSRQTPVILYNGAVICRADGTNFSLLHALRSDQVARVVRLAIEAGLCALVYEPDMSFALTGDGIRPSLASVERVTGFGPATGASVEFNGLPIDWMDSSREIPDIAAAVLIPTPESDAGSLVGLLSKTAGLSVTRSSTAYIEIRPEGANKGDALSMIAAERSLTPSNVLAIGDSDNDLEMLRWAGCSVAVANSTAAVRAQCEFLAEGAAGQGVVETLRLIYDARRHRLNSA